MMMVLSAKLREGNLVIFDNLKSETHKTKDLKAKLEKHNLLAFTSMIVDEEFEVNFERAVSNIPNVIALPLKHINIYEILKKEKLIFTQECFTEIQRRLVGQYTYSGKRNAIKKRLDLLEAARVEAEELEAQAVQRQIEM
jgi:ribosomal protein L4